MNLGKLLGAMSPGLSATGLFGSGAQGTGTAMLTGMSPLLALLLHHKNSGGAAPATPPPQDGSPVAPTANVMAPPQPMAQAMGPSLSQAAGALPQASINDPSKRRQLGFQLLQLGGQFANPYGPRY